MLEISNLVKSFAGERARKGGSQGARVYAVNDVSLQVEKGEMFTLLGPSGCGKTTTLRSIAGLEQGSGEQPFRARRGHRLLDWRHGQQGCERQ